MLDDQPDQPPKLHPDPTIHRAGDEAALVFWTGDPRDGDHVGPAAMILLPAREVAGDGISLFAPRLDGAAYQYARRMFAAPAARAGTITAEAALAWATATEIDPRAAFYADVQTVLGVPFYRSTIATVLEEFVPAGGGGELVTVEVLPARDGRAGIEAYAARFRLAARRLLVMGLGFIDGDPWAGTFPMPVTEEPLPSTARPR